MTRKSPKTTGDRATIASFFGEEVELLPGLPLRFTRPPTKTPACLALLDLAVLAEHLTAEKAQQEAPSSLLSVAEQSRYAGFTYPKRQHEWLGGRLTCKFAVLHLAAPQAHITMPALSVLPTENGAPRISCPSLPTWSLPAVSISHSDRYVVAMAARAGACGIDLQKTTAQTVRVADRFAAPAEILLLREYLPELAEPQRLTLLWAAKEALKKGLLHDQPVVFQGVTLQSLTRADNLILQLRYPGDRGRPAAITLEALDDYFLAYTIAPDHA
ncbi:MAG: 4'-phosphopantetheinyl transferase family protein [Desulfobulbaceae bacterium]